MKNLKLAARAAKERTVINVSDVEVGKDLVVIAGPCSVESEAQMFASARAVWQRCGANMLWREPLSPGHHLMPFRGWACGD